MLSYIARAHANQVNDKSNSYNRNVSPIAIGILPYLCYLFAQGPTLSKKMANLDVHITTVYVFGWLLVG